jgi:hypothetical protein
MSGVRFAPPGTLKVADAAGEPMAVSGARRRALLTSLLPSANVPVSSNALAEAVRDGSTPARGGGNAPQLHQAAARGPGTRGGRGSRHAIRVLDICSGNRNSTCRVSRRRAGTRGPELWHGTPLLGVPSQVLRGPPGGRMTCATPRCPGGSTSAPRPPRSPPAPGTASPSCSPPAPTASTARTRSPTARSSTPSTPRTRRQTRQPAVPRTAGPAPIPAGRQLEPRAGVASQS